MEKLQAALEKARSRRSGDAADIVPPSPAVKKPSSYRKDELWQNLAKIDLSSKALRDHHLVSGTASQKATPFDILRTKVLLQMRQNGWKTLAITSPMPQSGKTTMACNLALGLGRQGGLHTMLFDLDLQDPSVGDYFGYTPQTHVADMLLGDIPYADQAVRIGESVAISMAARRDSDPTRVLLAEQSIQTIQSVQSSYDPDIMIFDMPSILVGDNTRAFLRNVDCALIVARANSTKYHHFDTCEREITQYTNVLGTVLNAFRTKKNPEQL